LYKYQSQACQNTPTTSAHEEHEKKNEIVENHEEKKQTGWGMV